MTGMNSNNTILRIRLKVVNLFYKAAHVFPHAPFIYWHFEDIHILLCQRVFDKCFFFQFMQA